MILLLSSVLLCCEKEPKPQNDDDNEEENPIGIGLFSVSDSLQVSFAPGNLAEGGRSFVPHQYELGGYFGWGTGNHPDDTSED